MANRMNANVSGNTSHSDCCCTDTTSVSVTFPATIMTEIKLMPSAIS